MRFVARTVNSRFLGLLYLTSYLIWANRLNNIHRSAIPQEQGSGKMHDPFLTVNKLNIRANFFHLKQRMFIIVRCCFNTILKVRCDPEQITPKSTSTIQHPLIDARARKKCSYGQQVNLYWNYKTISNFRKDMFEIQPF